jgi:glycosyltransferase involved in cell wall biosynthesis
MPEGSLRKLLFLAYTFPPVSTGSGPRCVAMARCLPEGGWTMVPVVVENPSELPTDDTLLDLLPPDVRESRVIVRDPIGRFFRQHELPPAERKSRNPVKLLRSFVRLYLMIPDKSTAWSRVAGRAAVKAAHEHDASLIMSFGPPHSCHLAAMRAARKTGLPWIAHFGDLWMYDSLMEWEYVSRLSRLIQKHLEARVVRCADGILTTSWSSSRYFDNLYSRFCPPITHLHNGYDPQLIAPAPFREQKPGDRFLLTYTGYFMGRQNPEALFLGMKKYFQRRPESRLHMLIVGYLRESHKSLPLDLGIADRVEVTGRQPFTTALARQREADVLLVLTAPYPGSEVKNPTKVAEYLIARKPILALSCEGELSRLVERLHAGYWAPHEPDKVADVLELMEDHWSRGSLAEVTDMDEVARLFDMREGCRDLGAFMDSVVGSPRSGRRRRT